MTKQEESALERVKKIEARVSLAMKPEPDAEEIRDAIREYGFMFEFWQGEEGVSWDRFFQLWDSIPEDLRDNLQMLGVSKNPNIKTKPEGLFERVRHSLEQEVQKHDTAFSALNYFKRLQSLGLLDDMPPETSEVVGEILAHLIEQCKKDDGPRGYHFDPDRNFPYAFDWAIMLFNSVYIDGQESRDHNAPMNQKIRAQFKSMVEEKLALCETPAEAITFLIDLANCCKGHRRWLCQDLWDYEAGVVAQVDQDIATFLPHEPAAALDRVDAYHTIDRRQTREVSHDRHEHSKLIPCLLAKFTRAVFAACEAGQEQVVEATCKKLDNEEADYRMQDLARELLDLPPVPTIWDILDAQAPEA